MRLPPSFMGLALGAALGLLTVSVLLAAEDPAAGSSEASGTLPGHSWHGHAFNEGPRQQAYLMDGMPAIDFPITTTNELARRFFCQGIGQLHGFWYFEAERSFRRVLQLDTNCAMGYWGVAMANIENEKRARQFITNAVTLKSLASPREQSYIEALAEYHAEEKDGKKREPRQRRRDFVRAYENLIQEYPDDLEARALLIYQIWNNSGFGNTGDLTISSHFAVDTLARQVLEKDPLHPVHHYRIHLWDPEKPANALDSAARCGQGSPGIAHMWHMPGHTYTKLHRYDDAAWQQEASARVDHAHMIRDRVLPDQIHNYTHNNQWLVESWMFCGRAREAIELAKNLVELPRLMKTNTAHATNPKAPRYDFRQSSWWQGRQRLLEVLVTFELWDELIALSDSPYLDPTPMPDDQARLARAVALAWFEKDNPERASGQLAALDHALASLRDERQGAIDEAESIARKDRKSQADITKAMQDALTPFGDRVDRIERMRAEILARAALASGDTNQFKLQLEQAKEIPKDQLARLHWQAGDQDKALKLATESAEKATNRVQQWAAYADFLWRSGKTNDAQQAFQNLRQIHTRPDLDLPVIQRLAPIALSLNLPLDWRPALTPRDDVGTRPPLESLGPLYWRPAPAPNWALPDADGRIRSLKDYRGRPLIVVFFLGRSCVHCIEQLTAFTPAAKSFHDAGIDLVAISSDAVEGVRQTFRKGTASESFPFPLLSDAPLKVFKAWRVHDDFENQPLHGTFLIDANGLVRWQDISFDPFMETKFLLAEAKRLLRFGGAAEKPAKVAAAAP